VASRFIPSSDFEQAIGHFHDDSTKIDDFWEASADASQHA
jgi:hypothetical protein